MQVWGRARRACAPGPMADGQYGGALHVPPQTLLGVRGDAIYTTQIPQWSLPVERGGADDGRVGRMRLQGYLEGPMKIPTNEAERNKLRRKAAATGVDAAYSEFELQSRPDDDGAGYLPGEEDAGE